MFSIHVVEDDEQIRKELIVLLERNQYNVTSSDRFDRIPEDIAELSPDLVLLDLGLPYVDGHVICREVRDRSEVPLIVVTSRDNDLDELTSMSLGADDFIAKPYSPQILLARIDRVLKRTYKTADDTLFSYKGIELHPAKSSVSYQGKEVELTKNELRIMSLLMKNAEKTVSRQDIQNELWQSDEFVDDNTLTVNVNRLRSTLTSIGADNALHTRRGQGYYLELL